MNIFSRNKWNMTVKMILIKANYINNFPQSTLMSKCIFTTFVQKACHLQTNQSFCIVLRLHNKKFRSLNCGNQLQESITGCCCCSGNTSDKATASFTVKNNTSNNPSQQYKYTMYTLHQLCLHLQWYFLG